MLLETVQRDNTEIPRITNARIASRMLAYIAVALPLLIVWNARKDLKRCLQTLIVWVPVLNHA